MSDIIFECGSCRQTLVVEDSAAGETIECPKCSTAVLVPVGDVSGFCPLCQGAIRFTVAMAGDHVNCPACQQEIVLGTGDEVNTAPITPEAARRLGSGRSRTRSYVMFWRILGAVVPIVIIAVSLFAYWHNRQQAEKTESEKGEATNTRPVAEPTRLQEDKAKSDAEAQPLAAVEPRDKLEEAVKIVSAGRLGASNFTLDVRKTTSPIASHVGMVGFSLRQPTTTQMEAEIKCTLTFAFQAKEWVLLSVCGEATWANSSGPFRRCDNEPSPANPNGEAPLREKLSEVLKSARADFESALKTVANK